MTTPEAMEELIEALEDARRLLSGASGLISEIGGQAPTAVTETLANIDAALTKARQAPARPNDAAFIGPDDPLCLRLSKECIERIEAAEQARIAGAAALRNVPLGSRQAPEREGLLTVQSQTDHPAKHPTRLPVSFVPVTGKVLK
jgi:hypothetical protein